MLRLGNVDATHAAALRYHVDFVVDSLSSSTGAAAPRAGKRNKSYGDGEGGSDAASEWRAMRTQLADVAAKLEAHRAKQPQV